MAYVNHFEDSNKTFELELNEILPKIWDNYKIIIMP